MQKLRERLCTETEPRQLYKTLKKLSSQPVLGDILEEIGFRENVKLLKNQPLLVPFAKELAAKWSEGSQVGSQPETGPQQNFDLHRGPMTQIHRNSPENNPQKPATPGQEEDGSQVLEISSSSPQPSASQNMDTSSKQIASCSSNTKPARRKTQRGSFQDPQLDTESQGAVGKPKGTLVEHWPLKGMKPLTSKQEAVPAKQHLSPLKEKRPEPWTQEDYPPGSFEACLNYDSSSTLPPRKWKKKSTWKAEDQTPKAKVPPGKSQSCNNLNLLLDASPFPEITSNLETCSPPDVPENFDLHTNQEAAPWACRKTLKTPVYSGGRPARPLQQIRNKGHQAKPQSTRETHCQPALEEELLRSEQEEDCLGTQIKTAKPIDIQTETQKLLRSHESLELKLQTLIASIQSSQAKKPQGRQTKVIDTHAQATSPGQHADSGPRGEASPENVHSLPEQPGPGHVPRAPHLLLAGSANGSKKTQAKKPAPLMAKAFKDYKNRRARK
ncbi:elongin-A3-like [Cricetulus griseus]|uniref:Elongin-A3-like n=1 Tax=Cricetulus griseus TaxID=10029 RepID=A0A9J7JZX6_CRIGR|nr:elongin-A3-like [Cricetulus griseus]